MIASRGLEDIKKGVLRLLGALPRDALITFRCQICLEHHIIGLLIHTQSHLQRLSVSFNRKVMVVMESQNNYSQHCHVTDLKHTGRCSTSLDTCMNFSTSKLHIFKRQGHERSAVLHIRGKLSGKNVRLQPSRSRSATTSAMPVSQNGG